jgi:hypothetical protein
MSPIPFRTPPPSGGHIVGQPFTMTHCGVPMNLTLTCNCGGEGDRTVNIVGSVPATCPGCAKVYNALFNPSTNQIEMQIGVPSDAQKVPS